MVMPFSVIIQRRPISSNRSPHKNYTADLQAHAQQQFREQPLLSGDLYARIIWFYNGQARRTEADVDNIAKWILDALKGVVYHDDRQVVKCVIEKVDKTGVYRLSHSTLASSSFGELAALLGNLYVPHILSIEIDQLHSRLITFGPIDGENHEGSC
jgi:Holliday junction resolvase RusA-like endonuclease